MFIPALWNCIPARPWKCLTLVKELKSLGYRPASPLQIPGTYTPGKKQIDLVSRRFVFGDGEQAPQWLSISIEEDHVTSIRNTRNGSNIPLLRLEPRLIDSISPRSHEDRSLLRLPDVSPRFVEVLLSIEDQNFMHHWGVDPRGLLRAIVVNIRAARLAQGGSTITQQLIKNMFLSPERSFQRKFTEMIMALLLEIHYSKAQILEAYINQVYLGQSGNRAIHGFGLASQYYFARPLSELSLAEQALLVGMIRGPSYYNPRRHPERAKKRRNLVIEELLSRGRISPGEARIARKAALGIRQRERRGRSAYPAFLDLVRRQIRLQYDDMDLRSEGLRIFTTLDPRIQSAAERVLGSLDKIEQAVKLKKNSLQAAIVVLQVDTGEVLALVGDRKPNYAGFNRALDAQRPIGSLIKPAVYLTALDRPQQYSLASVLQDKPVNIKQSDGSVWRPKNYDRKAHGSVMLVDALSQSLNLATVNLGLEIGIRPVQATLRQLGIQRPLPDYPSLFLGAIDMSPIEVAQMYQPFANGGFQSPLRAIKTVLSHQQQPLSRYPLSIDQVVSAESNYLLNFALTEVVENGTARALARYFPAATVIAGKTGTTDNYRDSWFAGYGGNYLAVVWLGRDDNHSTRLSGSRGAMLIWAELMRDIGLQSLVSGQPEDIELLSVDSHSGLLAGDSGCSDRRTLPFILQFKPELAACARRSPGKKINDWFERLFGGKNETRNENR